MEALDLAARSAGGRTVERIVVDNGSGDDSATVLAESLRADELVLLSENRGFAAGVNAGLRRARGRLVLLLNSDTRAHGDAVARLAGALDDDGDAGLAGPVLLNEDGSAQLSAYRRFPTLATVFLDFCFPLANPLYGTRRHPYVLEPPRAGAGPRVVAHVMGAAMLVRADAARQAGPLDEGYFLYLEETEWQGRLSAAGWRVLQVPGAKITHLGGGSSSGYGFASPHLIASLRRYFGGSRALDAVIVAGALISLVAARAACVLRPREPRYRELSRACRSVVRTVITRS